MWRQWASFTSHVYRLCLYRNKQKAIVLHSIVVSCVACATDNTELWFSPFAKQRRILVPNPYLSTRISVRAVIGLLKKPLSICQSVSNEIRNTLRVIRWVRRGHRKRGAASQTLLTDVKLRRAMQAISCDVSFMSLLFFEPHTQKPASLKSKRLRVISTHSYSDLW